MIRSLVEHCGGWPQRWLYGISEAAALWMLRAAGRELRRRQYLRAKAEGHCVAVSDDDPVVRAIGTYRELKKRLKEMPDVKRKNIEIEPGRVIEIRELTWGEHLTIRERGNDLPATWPLEQQLPREAIADLGVSDVSRLADAIYALSYTTAESAPEAAGDRLGAAGGRRQPGQVAVAAGDAAPVRQDVPAAQPHVDQDGHQ